MLTWGNYSNGALGLGEAPSEPAEKKYSGVKWAVAGDDVEVAEPTLVRFDREQGRGGKRFCFAAAASEWHSGALAADLNGD